MVKRECDKIFCSECKCKSARFNCTFKYIRTIVLNNWVGIYKKDKYKSVYNKLSHNLSCDLLFNFSRTISKNNDWLLQNISNDTWFGYFHVSEKLLNGATCSHDLFRLKCNMWKTPEQVANNDLGDFHFIKITKYTLY